MEKEYTSLQVEIEHIKFWETCLNDLKQQFEILKEFIGMSENVKKNRSSYLNLISKNFVNNCREFSNEPSHLYYLAEILLDFHSCLGINNKGKELGDKIVSIINEITQSIEETKIKICNDNFKLINRCKTILEKIRTKEEEYEKIKKEIDNAQNYHKKIDSEDKYTYNFSKKNQAEFLLSEQIRKMDELKPLLDGDKKKLMKNSEKLKASMLDNFEIVIITTFKQLANLHQCFYLLSDAKIDNLNNIKKKIDNILIQLSNLCFDLNDYTEKKFGASKKIKTDGVNFFSEDDEAIANFSSSQLMKISYDVLNYVQIFMLCLRYRKKIMKSFNETIKEITKNEEIYRKEYNDSKKELVNKLNSLKNKSDGTQKNWQNFLGKEKISEIITDNNALLCPAIDTYVTFSRNEYNTLDTKWLEYKKKLIERQKKLNDFQNEIKNNERTKKKIDNQTKKERTDRKNKKLCDVIKICTKFIHETIPDTRNKDKKEMTKLGNSFVKAFNSFHLILNNIISNVEENRENSASLDIFEECKIIIIKYFNRFNIQNYDGFLEKMKIKLIKVINLQDEKLGKDVYNILNYKYSDSFMDESVSFKFQRTEENFNDDAHSKILFENENENELNENLKLEAKSTLPIAKNNSIIINENFIEEAKSTKIKNINFPEDDSKKLKNFTTKHISEIPKNSIDENSSFYDIENDKDSFNLIDDNKFNKITAIKDPYKNFKSEELERLKNIKSNTNELNTALGGSPIDSFNCALLDKVLLQGKLYLTKQKIVFHTPFNKNTLLGLGTIIVVPLSDITDISKKSFIKLFDNAIEIKTKKITLFFTSFVSRDHCYHLLKSQWEKNLKEIENDEKNKNEEEKEEVQNNTPERQLYLKKKLKKSKQISQMLDEIKFYERLEQLTKERMEIFVKEYRDEKNGFFIPDSKFPRNYAEHVFKDCPLFVCFKYICNMSTPIDEYGHEKGFFESLFIDRKDSDITFTESNDSNLIIPEYFDNGDYAMNLFTSFNKEEFENFLNEVPNWHHKYEYKCNTVHAVKKVFMGPDKVVMKDRFIAYFISPTLLIFDDLAYATGFPFCDNFVPLFRYKFECKITFNEKKGKFEFTTTLTILFECIFLVNFMLKDTCKSKAYSDSEETIKLGILDKLLDIVNIYAQFFKEIYEKTNDEVFQRKIILQQNMITGEHEEDDDLDGLEIGEDIQENNEEENKNEKKENNVNDENNNNENGEENKANNKVKKKIDDFVNKNKKYIFIGILLLIVIGIILSFFKNQGGTFTINTIFNLMILGVVFYLFKFRE